MSLLTNFPEIDTFFKKQQFDNFELNQFILEIEQKYSDKHLRKSALSLIKLEILKYNLKESIIEKDKIKSSSIKENKNNIHDHNIILNQLKSKSIESISKCLEWKSSFILTILKQKNIEKLNTEFLKENEFNAVKKMFFSRLKALEKQKREFENLFKSKLKAKKIQTSINKRNDVYTKISQNRGVGKIIYIRNK